MTRKQHPGLLLFNMIDLDVVSIFCLQLHLQLNVIPSSDSWPGVSSDEKPMVLILLPFFSRARLPS